MQKVLRDMEVYRGNGVKAVILITDGKRFEYWICDDNGGVAEQLLYLNERGFWCPLCYFVASKVGWVCYPLNGEV